MTKRHDKLPWMRALVSLLGHFNMLAQVQPQPQSYVHCGMQEYMEKEVGLGILNSDVGSQCSKRSIFYSVITRYLQKLL